MTDSPLMIVLSAFPRDGDQVDLEAVAIARSSLTALGDQAKAIDRDFPEFGVGATAAIIEPMLGVLDLLAEKGIDAAKDRLVELTNGLGRRGGNL